MSQASSASTSLPTDADQKRATSLVRDVYEEDYAAAKTAAQKSALSRTMIQKAAETKDDQAARFVLLRSAMELATSAGDVELAFSAIDQTAALYGIDARQVKSEVLSQVARAARSSIQYEAVALRATSLMDEHVAVDRFKEASNLGRLALNAARSAKNPVLAKEIAARIKEMQDIAKAFETVPSLNPESPDPHASLTVGRYLCFHKGDWEKGLPLLAAGSDERLKALAAMELQRPSSVDGQVSLGDAWWDLAMGSGNMATGQYRKRAEYWYLKIAPELKGVTRDRVKQRLAEVLPRTHLIHFGTPGALDQFVIENGSGCRLDGQSLQLTNAYITYRTYFDSISSVKIRGGTDSLNFRISVGMAAIILNWEAEDQNRFWYTDAKRDGQPLAGVTRPRALTPGQIHEIEIAQIGPSIVVAIDGRKHLTTRGTLFGTVGVYQAGPPATLSIQSIEIQGVADPTVKVTGPSHNNRY